MHDNSLVGAPEKIRTPDPQIRSLIPAHFVSLYAANISSVTVLETPVTSGFLVAMYGHLRYIPVQ